MGWFSKKQVKSADDALVERTLAVVQEVAQETPEDEQALLAMIDGIKMMPVKPSSVSQTPREPEAVASLPAVPFADEALETGRVSLLMGDIGSAATVERNPAAVRIGRQSAALPAAPPLARLSTRPLTSARSPEAKSPPRMNPPSAASADGLKQSDMRREIAARVQNFKAHQQRLNDEREARIKKIYAEMQAHLQASDTRKSPPAS